MNYTVRLVYVRSNVANTLARLRQGTAQHTRTPHGQFGGLDIHTDGIVASYAADVDIDTDTPAHTSLANSATVDKLERPEPYPTSSSLTTCSCDE